MKPWKSLLLDDPIEWLLEENNPSVRFLTLTEILDKPKNDTLVKKAKDNIMETGVVPKILSRQEPGGYWIHPDKFYVSTKYKGSVWSFIILAELCASGNDDRIKRACEYILFRSQDPESGGFAYQSNSSGRGDPYKIIPCLTGNMLWSLIRFGYQKDKRIQNGINWITKYQRFDDGVKVSPEELPYPLLINNRERCLGKHTCFSGIIKSLKALSEIPKKDRTKNINYTISQGVDFIFKHHVFRRSHNQKRLISGKWLHLGFPYMWKVDILEILLILVKLGYRDEIMEEAVNLLISKQDKKGRWKLEDGFNGRLQVNIEQLNKPSKWITFRAMKVLKNFCE